MHGKWLRPQFTKWQRRQQNNKLNNFCGNIFLGPIKFRSQRCGHPPGVFMPEVTFFTVARSLLAGISLPAEIVAAVFYVT